MKQLLLVIAFGIVGCLAMPNYRAQAATAQTAAGVAMSPAIQDRILGPTEKTVSFSVELANQTDTPLTFALSSNDFTALNQTGGLAFQGSDISHATDGNGLSSVLKLDANIVTLPAKSTKKITGKIDDVSILAPGGHYAAILAQVLPDGSARTGNKVSLNQVVSSLLFLETAGKGTKSLTLLKPNISSVALRLPEEVNLVFKATGNTQTIPRGIVTIERGGNEVGRGIINENSSLLLPNSTRLLQTRVTGQKRPIWLGTYTVRVQYRYEGSLGVSSYEKTFVYVNVQAMLILLALLIATLYVVWRKRSWLRQIMKQSFSRFEPPAAKDIKSGDNSHKKRRLTIVKREKKQSN